MESDLTLDMVAVDSSIPLIAKSSFYAKKGEKEFLNSGMYHYKKCSNSIKVHSILSLHKFCLNPRKSGENPRKCMLKIFPKKICIYAVNYSRIQNTSLLGCEEGACADLDLYSTFYPIIFPSCLLKFITQLSLHAKCTDFSTKIQVCQEFFPLFRFFVIIHSVSTYKNPQFKSDIGKSTH